MAEIILVTGGARSGKSDFALERAEQIAGERCFVATCEVRDQEMAERVEKHRQGRDEEFWATREEPLDIASIISGNEFGVYLIDCLTLWVSNTLADYERQGRECGEREIADEMQAVIEAARALTGTVIFVTNEVGMGIVPDNALARRYRDLVGLCNKMVAAAAGEVVLVSCGLPIHIKKERKD